MTRQSKGQELASRASLIATLYRLHADGQVPARKLRTALEDHLRFTLSILEDLTSAEAPIHGAPEGNKSCD